MNETPGGGNGIDIGYKGLGIRATGQVVVLLLVVAMSGSIHLWAVKQLERQIRMYEEHARKNMEVVLRGNDRIVQTQELLGCLLMLDVNERKALKTYTQKDIDSLCRFMTPWTQRRYFEGW